MALLHPSRRALLVGGGAGIGLLIAWQLWPRRYRPNLQAGPGESVLDAFLKIGADGRVTAVVPQVEMGQGVYTSLPQILADALGARWEDVGVEPAPLGPLYANTLLAAEGTSGDLARWWAAERAERGSLVATAGSTSVRAWAEPLQEAGATARALLCMAAAARWDADWRACEADSGFVSFGERRLPFGELAADAAGFEPPAEVPPRAPTAERLVGRPLPRLDAPSKVRGEARFAADVRLPGMVFAAARGSRTPNGRMVAGDRAAARAIPGVLRLVERPGWVAAVAADTWSAQRALDALAPRWSSDAPLPTAEVDRRLAAALAGDDGRRFYQAGDADAALAGRHFAADYAVAPSPHRTLEPLAATARFDGDRLEVWAPTQAQGLARAAAARAAGLPEDRVTIYPALVGGQCGRKMATDAVEQAAALTVELGRPVQLQWTRSEDARRDRPRAPARAKLRAALAEGGRLAAWRARIAGPEMSDDAAPPYAIPAVAMDHVAVDLPTPFGLFRGGAGGATCFFTESFVDELARAAGQDPFSFRMAHLSGRPRLARALAAAAASGGWDGGGPGSALGLACHEAYGSAIALVVAARLNEAGRPRVDRIAAAVDAGRIINPAIARQQVEGGALFGLEVATGFPLTPATAPAVTVELLPSAEPPGGLSGLAVPPVAPAVANALFAATGRRSRSLPLASGAAA